jgi:hypothetical protein
MIFSEAKQALARKLDINYSQIANNDLFSDDDLAGYINDACYMAWDLAFWDFTEHSKSTELLSADILAGYINYPRDIQVSSIYYLTIGGKEYKKKEFRGYKRYFEANSSATDKYWAEFKRLIFFNTNKATAGQTIDIYGKKNFVKLSADSNLLPFSPDTDAEQYSGNSAIIILAYSLALSSEKKKNPQQGALEEKRAYTLLNILSNQLEAGRASEEPKNTPMFNVPDFFQGGRGSSKGSPIGGFNN